MTLHLFNTLTKAKAPFTPLDPDNVRMYVCGPTVYDFAHIGNARPVIVFDVLYRLLRHLYGADHVTYVRNITDVDDKINARAAEEYPDLPHNEAIAKVTGGTTRQFHEDIAALGVLEPDVEPKCTGHIPEMIAMIETLIAKGHAYEAEGHVLLDVGSVDGYGRLSRRSLDEMIAGARVEVAPYKKNPADSVLWKPSDDTQPGWESPWGRGRPGWHIECSAMAEKHLGDTFDIHGGGIDLQFPHHENELAQSCAAHGTDIMAQVWMHNGFLQVEGQKMSKSLGNFITIHELLATEKFGGKKWSGEVLRLAMLMTHYREPIDWTVRRLEEAEHLLEKWRRMIPANTNWNTKRAVKQQWDDVLFDDPEALAHLANDLDFNGFLKRVNELVADVGDAESATAAFAALKAIGLISFEDIVSLTIEEAAERLQLDEQDILRAMTQRLDFIKTKNWPEADRIRDEMLAQGIQLMDGKDPETGERVTTWEIKR